jgi:hypothetical protein
MTMVLSAMTDDHIFVVSDRRMTDGFTGRLLSSTENKAVVLNGELVLTYTGLCNLDGIPTDAWVTEQLVHEPIETWLQVLLNRTGAAIRRTRLRPDLKRHSFLLTGYAKMPRGKKTYRPVGFLISNYHRPDGTIMRVPESKFWLSLLRLGNTVVRIDSIGRDLTDQRRITLEKMVRRQLRATPQKPQRVLDILAAEIRAVASKDPGVGSEIMAVSFPMAAVRTALHGVLVPHDEDWQGQLISVYSADDSTVIGYSPAIVQPGMQMLGISVSNDPRNFPLKPHRLFDANPHRFKQKP